MWQKLITIIVSIIFIVTALYLAKTKKIDSACFEKYDVITWSVFSLALAIFNCYEKISVFNENLLWSVCHTFCGFVREIVMLPTVWYYGCLILFLLIRSGNVKVGRKTIIKIFIALVVWAFLILFLHNEFVWILAPDARVFGITVVSLRLSTYFMWMRYLILLWFAILMGQRKIGFTCGIICSGGTFLVAGIAATLFLDAQMVIECIGLPESIGYIVLGLGVIVSYMVNKKQKN